MLYDCNYIDQIMLNEKKEENSGKTQVIDWMFGFVKQLEYVTLVMKNSSDFLYVV